MYLPILVADSPRSAPQLILDYTDFTDLARKRLSTSPRRMIGHGWPCAGSTLSRECHKLILIRETKVGHVPCE